MSSCNDKKTRYTMYKTLSYVIKCIFLMCAFLFVSIFNEQDKVEAATVAFNTNNTSACWNASGTSLNVTANCNKYEYVVNFSHTVTNGSVTSIEEFYVNVGSTSYGGQMYTQSGSGQKMRCRGSKVKNIDLTITYSSSATSVTYSSSFTRTTLKICTSMGTDNSVSITIPTSQMSYSLTLKANMKVTYKKAGSGVEYPSSTISLVDKVGPTTPTIISNGSGGNWSSSDVYIKVGNSTDYFTGVSYYQYSYDKSTWYNDIDGTGSYNDSSGAYGSWRAERNNTVYFRAVDGAGNVSSASSGTAVKIDKTAPSSSVSVTNSSNGNWSSTDVSLTVSGGTDTGSVQSGFSKYQYSYDKSTWLNWDSSTVKSGNTWTGTWVAERNNTVYFRVCDVAGNCSSASSSTTTVKIDKTSPVLAIGTPTNGTVVGSGTSTAYHAQPSKSLTATFTDNLGLSSYSSTSYYRYKWCTSSSSCGTSWTAITGTRTSTQVSGSITTPSTAGVHYLWIEGDVKDNAGNYMSNSTNIGGITSTSSSDRVFKFNIDNTAPVVSVSSGNTSTYTYLKNGSSITITITDSSYGFNASGGYLSVELWDGEDPVASGDLTVSSSNSGITTKTYTMTISTTVTHELKVRISALTDYAGNAATTAIYLYYIDNTPPTLTIGTPSGGTTTGSGTSTNYISAPSRSLTITFTDNYALYNYNSTSYYRYKWCTSSSSCSTSWTAITGTRTSTQVSGSITTPSTGGTAYLWIEGNVKDNAGHYMSNSTNIGGITSTSSSNRIFKFTIDTTAPVLAIGTPTNGTVVGSGTSTAYHAQPSKSVTVTFTDNAALSSYSSTSYYRYKWCTSSSSCDASWTAITGTRTLTQVSGSITTPSTAGVHYLWIEGDARDVAGNYMSNSTNIGGITSTSYSTRIFKFNIDNTAPVVSVSSGNTSTYTYLKNGSSITITITDSSYGFNASGGYLSVELWDGEDPVASGDLTVSSSNSGITTKTYTMTISTTVTHELKVRISALTDYAGNAATTVIYLYYIDNTPPTLTIGTPSGGTKNGSGTSTIYYSEASKSMTITFTENYELYAYNLTSYYRYKWCSDSSSCNASWTAITGTRTSTQVSGSITTPSTEGIHYLWIEGDARDLAINYVSNSTNIEGLTSTSSDARVFKVIVDRTAPILTIGTPTSGTIIGTGTNTTHYAQSNKNVTITFTDNYALYYYTSTSYYRYKWCTSSSSCDASWTAITGTRNLTQVSGSITTPSTAGVHYLWIEGDVKDLVGHYMSNSANINAVGTTSPGARIFKFNIDNTPISVSSRSYSNYKGAWSNGSTTSTTYVKNGDQIEVTLTDSVYGFNTSGSYLAVSMWDGEDPIEQGYISLSKTSTGITTIKYTITITTTLTYELNIRLDNLVDYAGNTTSETIYLYHVDNGAPNVTAQGYNTYKGSWYTANTTSYTYLRNGDKLSITLNDSLAGFDTAGSYFRVKLWDGEDPIQNGYLSLSKAPSGGYQLVYNVSISTTSTRELLVNINGLVDNIGNATPDLTFMFYIDNTAPVVGSYSNTSGGGLTNKNVTISVTGGSDAHSNIHEYKYSTNNATYLSLGASKTWTAEIDTPVYIRLYDNVGNYSYMTTTNVRIDRTKPITNISVTASNNTAIVYFTDNKSISSTDANIGNDYEYYISSNSNLDVTKLTASQWIKPAGNVERGSGNDQMHIGRGEQYLYIKLPNDITDTAGNTIRDPYSTAISGYTVIKTTITGGSTTPISPPNINSRARSGVQITGNYVVEIVDDFVIVTFDSEATLPNGFTMKTINEALSGAGYRLISVDDNAEFDFESSNMFVTLIGNDVDGSLSTQNDIYQLMVLINAPITDGGNAGARVVEQGEELGNIAVAFTSDIEFSVDTLITLNGVKVKEVDTNKPGVYEVRSIATDIMGRVNKVNRTIVVKEGDKEEVEVKVEEIKETPEVITPVVVNNAPVEVQPEVNTNRKVVENIQVEMRIENKEEVKGYKKKEEKNKKNKENKGTFKLFSKWFFKVYDG